MLDTLEATFALLLADTALAVQVSTRIYGMPGLPSTYRGEKALLVVEAPGAVDPTVPLMAPGVWLHGYGPTPRDARTVVLAAADALHHKGPVDVTVTGGKARLLRGHVGGTPLDVKEPETGWFRCTVRCGLQWIDRVV